MEYLKVTRARLAVSTVVSTPWVGSGLEQESSAGLENVDHESADIVRSEKYKKHVSEDVSF